MAVFKCPKITTDQRVNLIFEESEILYDTNLKTYFGGDGVTMGGFPIGGTFSITRELITITQANVDSKSFALLTSPNNPQNSKLTFINGTVQLYGIDFVINENIVEWEGLGLDGFIEEGDIILIEYN
jgi:hypothetical protein